MPPDTCNYYNPPLSRISPRPQAWSCCDTEDSGRKLSLTWELKEKRDTFEPSHIQLHQISRKHRGRSSLQYNRLPPRKSDIKNTIESWPQFQFLFRKRFMFIKTQKLGANYVSRCTNQNSKEKDLIGPADNSFQTTNMGPGTFRLGKERTYEAQASTIFLTALKEIPRSLFKSALLKNNAINNYF